jgi:TRAP-type transport system small permease protein
MLAFIEKTLLRVVETIGLAILLSLTFAVIYSTTMRYFGASPSWYDELASVLLAWLTYFGATYAVFMRAHMGFGGLVTALPRPIAVALTLLSECLVLVFFGVIAWFGYQVLAVAAYDSLLSIRWLTLDIVQSVIPVTAVLMIVGTLLTMPRALRNAAAGIDTDHAEIAHAIAEAEADIRQDKDKSK